MLDSATRRDAGLFLLRVGIGAMMLFGHGLGKVSKFFDDPTKFADPIGVGPVTSLGLAASAEAGCALLIIVGFYTRLAAIPLAITMLVAAFIIHGGDPWGKKEFAMLYAVPVIAIFLTGPGRWSIDGRQGRA